MALIETIESEFSGDSSGEDNLEDNDLTNLQWLSSANLLQNMQVCNSETEIRDLTEDNENVRPAPEEVVTADDSVNKSITSVPPVFYDPITHRNAKPPYSFSSLIFMAIESAPNKALPVKDIYQWIVDHYPYYQSAPAGWKNTVRHNLSLNKCFRKLDKSQDDLLPISGKGSLWCVDPDLRPNLLQAVRRTPQHIYPYMSLAKTNPVVAAPRIQLSSNSNNALHQTKKALSTERVQSVVNIPSPNLFPFLSKRLLIPITKIIRKDKDAEEAETASAMLTLQCNDDLITPDVIDSNSSDALTPLEVSSAPVITVISPTNDHNYYNRSTSTQVIELIQISNPSEEQKSSTNKRKFSRVEVKKEDSEDSNDEGMRGAEALLNLASGQTSNKKQTTQSHDRPIILKKCKKE